MDSGQSHSRAPARDPKHELMAVLDIMPFLSIDLVKIYIIIINIVLFIKRYSAPLVSTHCVDSNSLSN